MGSILSSIYEKCGKKKIIIPLVIVAIAFNWGCKKEASPVQPLPAPDTIIPTSTKPIDSTSFSNQLVSISQDSSTFVFNQGSATIDNLQTNDVLVSNKGLGMLRKVTSVAKSNGKVTVQTAQATLTDAIQKGSIEIEKPLSPVDTSKILYKCGGVQFSKSTVKPTGFSLELRDVVIYDADGDTNTTNDQIVANGNIDLSQTFKLDLSVDNWQIKTLTMSTTFTEEMQLSISMDLINISYKKTKEILRVEFTPFTVFIGIVPVVITPILSINVGVDGEIYANLSSSISQQAEFTSGLKYDGNSWSPIANETHSFTFQPPTITVGASLRGFIGAELQALIYGVVGPTLQPELYSEVDANPSQNPWLNLYAGISVEAGVEVEVLSHLIAGYQATVLNLRTSIWTQSSPPQLPPAQPSNPNPADSATSVSTSPTLSWNCNGPESDPLTYDVYFGTDNPPATVISTELSGTSVSRIGLLMNTEYYWKVVAKDGKGGVTTGNVWRFMTTNRVVSTGTWTQKATFGGAWRVWVVSFSIGSKGYVGCGWNDQGELTKDFWEYDSTTNAWTRKADFPGLARQNAVGFSIGSMGYVGLGQTDSGLAHDFWQYNPVTDLWVQKADFDSSGRTMSASFVIGDKGYIVGGKIGSTFLANTNEVWEYDPQGNAWSRKADFPGQERETAMGFSSSTKGYYGTGFSSTGICLQDFWQFDPVLETWTQKADFGGGGRTGLLGVFIDGKGYAGLGGDLSSLYKDIWQYDPSGNQWIRVSDYAGLGRIDVTTFTMGTSGYVGLGVDSSGARVKDIWKYTP